MLPSFIVLDPILEDWLREDIGRGDRSTSGLFSDGNAPIGKAVWIAKADGVVAGLPIAARVFQLLDHSVNFMMIAKDGQTVKSGDLVAKINGSLATLLMGERVALNLVMHLSGIASTTAEYAKAIANSPTRLVDTRKTIPGMRLLEKYATFIGGAINHRYGLDDAVMLKDNHIAAAGGITEAVQRVREHIPFTTLIEVETESIVQVKEAMQLNLDVIMLDNMPLSMMREAIDLIRQHSPHTKIEASGNITLTTITQVAELGVDYISTSAMVTRSPWLDISMRIRN
ncbi:MAG: carboxylating nicotinate-nucleotide diphosphorylase [Pseudanabaena sp.]|jgi:nicotinate-nucleotide pyrophosphorylase (carboxylating)|nr:carboxylating nicotinate-nucleotide diphosphorylase [Pseudanabaena sp. M090S1SP2A07QC]MCA6510375.1 carboxylating nicotinate-nucleotide diphosphorylase [Pseudanabaena sp. M109S1SP2A07QC]MCA6572609.1 carboxylating nicotinate-nucleotide diphosphorylase [Pseudanabaena sp. M53BS1SP1A06MG]MCA6582672.1 carboxylating nicotinate-nucleotide diphosphorylase [Pseudanabaena sp. M34BS1SP1A06MG]MCA6593476.1 carboxylating nicotinate-nucleotide diphosphorylase [Pseudanabaena sp. M38BS1SP1A06MG]MCA6599084.1 